MQPVKSGSSAWLLGALAALSVVGCGKPSYLQVQVAFAPDSFEQLAPLVAQVAMVVFDKLSDAGPLLLPTAPEAGIFFDGGELVVQGLSGTTVTVALNGLDQNGNVIASGVSSQGLIAGSSNSMKVTLAPHCASFKGCDANAFCAGLVSCTGLPALGFGSCTAAASDAGMSQLAPTTPCGPCKEGMCQAGICMLATCGCSQPLDGGGMGYIVDASIGQICNSAYNDDLDAGACRTNCQPAHCGDGVVDPGERCDLGALNGTGAGCNDTCDLLGMVTTLAGSATPGQADGYGAAAGFGRPYGLALSGNQLFVADSSFKTVRAVELDNRGGPAGLPYVQTLVGGHSNGALCVDGDGAATDSSVGFCMPNAIVPFDGGLLITDYGALRFFSFSTMQDGGTLSTFGGLTAIDGTEVPGFDAGPLLPQPGDVALFGNPSGMTLLWPNLYTNTSISAIIAVTDLLNNPLELETLVALHGIIELGGMTSLGTVIYTTNTANPGDLYAFDTANPAGGIVTPNSSLLSPDGVCGDGDHSVYICETEGGEGGGAAGDIKQFNVQTGALTLLAGGFSFPNGGASKQPDGLGSQAGFFDPAGCVFDTVNHILYVSDRSGNEIRMIQ